MRIDIPKAIQAAAAVLRTAHDDRMSYIRLLKLLYIAERESFKERGRPIIGDRVSALDHGPVLGNTYNLIKGEHIEADQWSQFIRKEGYEVALTQLPGTGELSPWEIGKLHEVAARYAHLSDWELVKLLHAELGEWQKHKPEAGGSNPIPLEDILAEVGRAGQADAVREQAEAGEGLRQMLTRLAAKND